MKAATAGPWHDNLRHMFEAGRSITTLAYWHGCGRDTMRRWLEMAGTEFKHRRSKRADVERREQQILPGA